MEIPRVYRKRRRRILDIWSMLHFFFGTVVTLFGIVFSLPFATTLVITFVLAFLWEWAEREVRLRETRWNIVSDVVLPVMAVPVTFFLVGHSNLEHTHYIDLLVVAIIVYISLSWLAWEGRLNHEAGFGN